MPVEKLFSVGTAILLAVMREYRCVEGLPDVRQQFTYLVGWLHRLPESAWYCPCDAVIAFSSVRWQVLAHQIGDREVPISDHWVEKIRPVVLGWACWPFAGILQVSKPAAVIGFQSDP